MNGEMTLKQLSERVRESRRLFEKELSQAEELTFDVFWGSDLSEQIVARNKAGYRCAKELGLFVLVQHGRRVI